VLALADVPQQSTQLFLARRLRGVAHSGRPQAKAAASAHNPSIELSHFGIILRGHDRNTLSKASV
jgi:hypothetical protein